MEQVALASDHAGYALKESLKSYLHAKHIPVVDLGTDSEESVDYPDYGIRIANAITSGEAARGIAICGSGIGISIAANRNPSIRCALCHDTIAADLARKHNDANVLALGARFLSEDNAKAIVDHFLVTEFEGGRHVARVEKLGVTS